MGSVLSRRQNLLKGNGSHEAPPRLSATRKEINDSVFYSKKKLTYDNYKLQSVDVHLKKRKWRVLLPTTSAKSNSSVNSTPSTFRRPLANPYWEFFIGMTDNLISLMRNMNSHGKVRSGEIYFRRSEVTTKRLSLRLKCSCSHDKLCRKCDNGIFRWQSTTALRFSESASYPVPDVLYALGVNMTPNTMVHSDQLLSSMLLTPPSRMLLKEIIRVVVNPYFLAKKQYRIRSLWSTEKYWYISNSLYGCRTQ